MTAYRPGIVIKYESYCMTYVFLGYYGLMIGPKVSAWHIVNDHFHLVGNEKRKFIG